MIDASDPSSLRKPKLEAGDEFGVSGLCNCRNEMEIDDQITGSRDVACQRCVYSVPSLT